jgi:hypothetical protein
MVEDDAEITEEQWNQILSSCDPATARLGEGFLDPEIRENFDDEMLLLLQEARKAWV